MSFGTSVFGETSDGRTVDAIDIGSDDLTVRMLTFGAVINDVRLTALGHPLTLGSTEVAPYEGAFKSFGSLMGPVVNRIKDARATIAGKTYEFETNNLGRHSQHSGSTGSHLQVWDVTAVSDAAVTLALDLPDGLGGFPGNRRVTATYTVEGTSLTMQVRCTTDAPTIINFANHSYWNLDGSENYGGHTLQVHANHYLPPDDLLMPTGQIAPVEGTSLDFREPRTLSGDDTQFFDLNYCFSDCDQPLRELAVLTGLNGVKMTMASTAPGLQAYDAGTMKDQDHPTHIGTPYKPYSGFALEAQRWPGALAHSHFPTFEYGPTTPFEQTTRWTFEA
ncbi:MAG: aldose epimerase family protein [Pseudomonadota bacterium]